MDDSERLNRDLWEARQGAAASTEGEVVSVDFGAMVAEVDSSGIRRLLTWAGPAPFPGARVRVVKAGQQSFCMMAAEGSSLGTVVSSSGGLVTVTGDDLVTYEYPYEEGETFSSGNRVVMDHARQVVLMRLSTDTSGGAPVTGGPVAPPPVSKRHTRAFRPIDSANWWSTGGRWDAPYADVSVSRSAYYFYGSQIADTIPNSATVVDASIYVEEHWDNVPGVASLLGTHTHKTRPGGGPLALSGATAIDNSGHWNITGLATALKNGTAFGVGFAQNTGWRRFGPWTSSGTITIVYDT